jgi:biotin carboxyl carrier protein
MAFYYVTIDQRQYQVQVNGGQVLVDGKPMAEVLKPLNDAGLYLLQRGLKSLELFCHAPNQGTLEVSLGSRRVLARVETWQRRGKTRAAPGGAGLLTAPMPGVVVSVLVNGGDPVQEGQVLVVLESMKMQMQLRSTSAGTVKTVAVQPDQRVEKGATLVQLG